MNKDSLESICIQNFIALESKLNSLPNLLSSNQYAPSILVNTPVKSQLQDIFYKNDQDGRITSNYWGSLGISDSDLKILKEINSLKITFQKSVIALRNQNKNLWDNTYQNLSKRCIQTHSILNESNLTRLHLKQTYRQIPVLETQPQKIAFSWYTSGRSIKRLSKPEILNKLIALGEDKEHIQLQIQELSSVSDSHFAQVQNQAPTIRANILFRNGRTQSFNASLPIFFPLDTTFDPQITELPEATSTQRNRKVRSDVKISDKVFLKSLRIHRYI